MNAPGPTRPRPFEGGEDGGRDAVRQALGALSTLVPVGLFAADAAGTCWYVNQRLVDTLELELEGFDDRPLRLELRDGAAPRLVPVRGGEDEPAFKRLETRVMPLVRLDGSVDSFVGLVLDLEGPSDGSRPIRPSERLVDALVDRSPEVMTVLNADGTWRYSNAAAWRLLGYQSEFDPVDGILALIHPDDVGLAAEALERLREGEDLGEEIVEVRVRASDGTWRYLENSVENLLEDPVVHGFLLRSRDVTERTEARRALLEANQRLSTLIKSLHLAVLLEDERRSIVFTNDAFVNLFELPFSADQLAGHTIAEMGAEFFRRFGDPTQTSGERARQLLTERRPVVGDRLVMLDGRVLERDYLPITLDGEYHGHVFLFRDVSAQAKAETEWASLISHQRHENERLVELDRVKAAFLAEISHELRTPLTSILSFTELLADGLGRDDPAEQGEFLDIIRRNAERLLRLVEDLLLLDRIETGAMPLEMGTVDVPDLVSSCVQSFSPAAESKSISLESEVADGPSIPGDQVRLAQLLDVLVSNAVKFTPENGRVLVTASPRDRLWHLEVVDSGIGIPADELASLFERFYRASNARSSRIPGSGLGLAVARAIAELHGGTIALRSSAGSGTTAIVTLPFGEEDGARFGAADG